MGNGQGKIYVRRWDYSGNLAGGVTIPTAVRGVTVWRGIDYLISTPSGATSYPSDFPYPTTGINSTTLWGGQQFLVGGTPFLYRSDLGKTVGTSAGLASPPDSAVLCTRGDMPWSQSMPLPVWNGDIVAVHFISPSSVFGIQPLDFYRDELVFSVRTKTPQFPRSTWVDKRYFRVPADKARHFCGMNGGTYHALFWFRIFVTGNYAGICDGDMVTDALDKSDLFFAKQYGSHLYSGIPPKPVFHTLQNSVERPAGMDL